MGRTSESRAWLGCYRRYCIPYADDHIRRGLRPSSTSLHARLRVRTERAHKCLAARSRGHEQRVVRMRKLYGACPAIAGRRSRHVGQNKQHTIPWPNILLEARHSAPRAQTTLPATPRRGSARESAALPVLRGLRGHPTDHTLARSAACRAARRPRRRRPGFVGGGGGADAGRRAARREPRSRTRGWLPNCAILFEGPKDRRNCLCSALLDSNAILRLY